MKRTIDFAYDENGNSTKRAYNEGIEEFQYDIRNLLTQVTHKKSETDTDPKVTTYQYNNNGQTSQELLPNNNLTTYTYNLDGSLYEQLTKKDSGNGAVVNRHTLEYNANGHRTKDTLQLLDAKGTNVNSVLTYTYDPMDRIAGYTKTGDNARTETYVHDANNNVIEQTIDGTTTTYNYDRNRLVSAATGGSTAKYNYDVYGRLRSVTSGSTLIEQTIYDGFDHVKEHKALKEGSTTEYNTTQYSYDPMDRTTQKISKAGTPDSKTTDFAYLGLSEEVLLELENAQVVKSYQYSPTGKRLAMINHKDTGDVSSYYGYNTHTDVEMLYKPDGSVEGTYGYTAYGKEDKAATTGVDDPDPADNPDPNYDPDDPVNDYRYNAKRWDPSTKSYDMGFRDYSPGLNRFTTLDMYNGALQDMGLSTSPWTNNRYAFTGGNPISNIEWDGHVPLADGVYQTAPVSDYNRAISVGENLYGTSIKKDAGYDQRKAQEAFSLHVYKVDGLGNACEWPCNPEVRGFISHEVQTVFGIDPFKDYSSWKEFLRDLIPGIEINSEKYPLPIGNIRAQRFTSVGDSKILAAKLKAAGEMKLASRGYAAHHIVPGNETRRVAQEVRDLFDEMVGADQINEAFNGVWLPHNRPIEGQMYHNTIHTRRYYQELYDRLSRASDRESFLRILGNINRDIQNNNFPY